MRGISTSGIRASGRPLRGVVTLSLASLLLASCSLLPNKPSGPFSQSESPQATERTVPPVKGTELPVDAKPEAGNRANAAGGTCPYLDGQWLQNTNGQRLTGVTVDNRFDPVGCTFWSYEDVPQAQVLVRKMRTNTDAVKVVDTAAPINTTLKALKPEGWSGGRKGGDRKSGAIYAVWKDETAVVVWTAQAQSVKAQEIAEQTIKNLKL